MMIKKALARFIFLIGWLLSPLTFWNDALVNIPLSYICANIFVRIHRADFLFTLIAFYWLSNAIGLLLMYLTGKSILKEKGSLKRELTKLLIAIAIYSLVLILLNKFGILRPI